MLFTGPASSPRGAELSNLDEIVTEGVHSVTIARVFYDWPRLTQVGSPFDRCSPALQSLLAALRDSHGVQSLGCYGVRPIRSGQIASTHSFGAAIDLAYGHEGSKTTREDLCIWLVAYSDEWGIQAIHDYVGQRIWRAGRTVHEDEACSHWWRAQRKSADGMGQPWATWVHVEVTRHRWDDARTAAERGIA